MFGTAPLPHSPRNPAVLLYLHQVPEVDIPILRATDDMGIVMGKAAVNLVVNILMPFIATNTIVMTRCSVWCGLVKGHQTYKYQNW